ncbi:DUF4232 domain-containing protein [Streptomyces cocklensis]|uniref:DUF4232 domain-containing protein n=1 Tax=Actinacidiphila cocklensis TaxID=887465 RepID=A0A9W4GVG1_9ACTN|nr:DUF4232 domain-containing protein [Actinacidiphila cocklensis]MDD1057828.1 DUF4232 domain-containing protein [Actinacidiphila cocklensis]WSX78687.1 DUF4232 domain-containing protein [Streptomyces sp. NBC_00899]CAG6398562.1 conserved exported hypothetical protein [Actinacidiphila cocklensis]
MGTRKIGRTAPALVLVTAGLALAACGPSDASGTSGSAPAASSAPMTSSDAPTPTEAPSVTATSTPAPATTATASPAATAATGSTVPGCTTSHLKVTVQSNGSGAGSSFFTLAFQNTGSSPCTLFGYPGVSFVKAGNVQLGKAAARTPASKATVTLIPNAHAFADLRTVNGQGGFDPAQCQLTTVPSLRIFPPNQRASVNIPWNQKECVGSTVQNLQVGPVHSNR